MSEMVERVARAIEGQMAVDDNSPEDLARAAIAAMREPTEAMIDAGYEHCSSLAITHDSDARGTWRLMIDEALE